MAKSVDSPYRGPGFGSSSQWLAAPVPRIPMSSCDLLGNLDACGAHKNSCRRKFKLKTKAERPLCFVFFWDYLMSSRWKYANNLLCLPFVNCPPECHIISSVFYIPGTYHPSISHISPRWRSPVSSGEASPGNLLTGKVRGKKKTKK